MEKSLLSNNTTRNTTIDIAKGLGIILVVFAHMNYTNPYQTIIYGFHMPLFFIISGLLFFPEKYGSFSEFLIRKIKSLICPYIVFVCVTVIAEMGLLLEPGKTAAEIVYFVMERVYCYVCSRGSMYMMNYPMWFILCLFLAEIIFYFVTRLKGAAFWITSFGLTALGWFVQSDLCGVEEFLRLPWSAASACFIIGFFAIGYKMRPKLRCCKEKLAGKRWKALIIAILLMAATAPLALANGKVSIGSKILNNGLLLYLTGCLGTLSILSLSLCIRKSKFLQFCGRNSFPILAVHVLIKSALFDEGSKLSQSLNYMSGSIVHSLLPFAIVFLLSLLFAEIYAVVRNKIIIPKRSKS